MIAVALSPDQKEALDFAVDRIRLKNKYVTLGGYAGTGKTTITGEIVKVLRPDFPRIAFACFTGKAYKVLEAKLKACEALLDGIDYCGTIHSLVYNARRQRETRSEDGIDILVNKMKFHDKEDGDSYDLIVVDEASMVNEELHLKLLEFKVPILYIGDHGQLPPVKGTFNLMADPHIRLTRIHRQAEGDPIIRLSVMAREDGNIPYGDYSQNDQVCQKIASFKEDFINQNINPLEWAVIAGTNKKRVERNKWARWRLGHEGTVPVIGDRVVCLRNVHAFNVFNGMTGTVTQIKESEFLKGNKHKHAHYLNMGVRMDAEIDYWSTMVFKYQFNSPKPLMETVCDPAIAQEVDPDDFGHLWDFGYCLTAHKSQGSEFGKVVVYEEASMRKLMERTLGDEGWRRWLYTAVTRAKKQLIIVGE